MLEGATAAEFEGFWRDYLDLDRDYAAVRAAFARDPRLAPCVAFAPGIRVLRQPAFEALIAFIVSQNNNVPRIKGILARLCALFGEPLPGGARAFPAPERLAACSKEELAPLRSGLGGRATSWTPPGRWRRGRWICRRWPSCRWPTPGGS